MGTTICYNTTPAKLFAEELGLDRGYLDRKVIVKARGEACGDGRHETWMIIEQDTADGGRERFGVVGLLGTYQGGASCKMVDFSMGPGGIPPERIAAIMDTVPCSGYDTPAWRDSIKLHYAATVKVTDVKAGQAFRLAGWGCSFEMTPSVSSKGTPIVVQVTEDGERRRCALSKTQARTWRVAIV